MDGWSLVDWFWMENCEYETKCCQQKIFIFSVVLYFLLAQVNNVELVLRSQINWAVFALKLRLFTYIFVAHAELTVHCSLAPGILNLKHYCLVILMVKFK